MQTRTNPNSPTNHSRPASRVWLCGVFILLCALSSLSSCNKGEYSEYYDINPAGWMYADTIKFAPVPQPEADEADADTPGMHHGSLAIALRHNNRYEYSNIWLQLSYHTPERVCVDTVNIHMADRFGNWYGRGIGVSYQYVDTVLRDIDIDMRRPIEIRHIMRADTLENIEQIGVIFIEQPHNLLKNKP